MLEHVLQLRAQLGYMRSVQVKLSVLRGCLRMATSCGDCGSSAAYAFSVPYHENAKNQSLSLTPSPRKSRNRCR